MASALPLAVSRVHHLAHTPELFVDKPPALRTQVLDILVQLYLHAKAFEKVLGGPASRHGISLSPLASIVVDHMDDEQIWEQLQLHTLPLARLLDLRLDELDILSSEVAAVSSKLTKPEELFEDEDDDEDDDEDEDEHEHDDEEDEHEHDDDDEDDDEDENEEDDNVPARASRKRKRLDDDDSGDDAAFGQDEIDFFDAGEMERFVQDAEERQARKRARRSGHESDSDDDDDEDEDGDDDEDDENDDDDNDEAGGRDDEEDEDDDDEDDDEDEDGFDGAMLKYDDFFDPPKSKHQLELEKKKELIAELENANLAPKPWHLSGEVSAKDRPAESLLEQAVFFEHATKAPPVITEAVTVNLENIIKRRIAEESWDDVIRKVEAEAKEFQPKKELDHEKSKASLAEIYEQQYMQQIEGVQAKNELQAKHLQIENMFRSLSAKLDALSNFHATPRKNNSEPKIHSNVAAISVEEKIPTAVSDASLLAPQEIYTPKRAEKAKSEMTAQEKEAARRAAKRSAKKAKLQKERDLKLITKLNPGLGNKYATDKAVRELRTTKQRNVSFVAGSAAAADVAKSSSKFFAQIQASAKADIDSKRDQPTNSSSKKRGGGGKAGKAASAAQS